jgi:hypothetical protein
MIGQISLILTIAGCLQALGVPIGWNVVAFVVAFVVGFGVAGVVAGVVAFGVASGVAFVVAFGVAGVVASVVAVGVAGGVVVGVAVGVAGGVVVGVAVGVVVGVAFGVGFGVAVGVAVGVGFGVGFGVAVGVDFGVAVGVAVGVSFIATFSRFDLWLWQTIGLRLHPPRYLWGASNHALPQPLLQQRIRAWLAQDVSAAVANCNQLHRYTYSYRTLCQALLQHWQAAPALHQAQRVADVVQAGLDFGLLQFVNGKVFIPYSYNRRRSIPYHPTKKQHAAWLSAARYYAHLYRGDPAAALQVAGQHPSELGDNLMASARLWRAASTVQQLAELAALAAHPDWETLQHSTPLRADGQAWQLRLLPVLQAVAVVQHSPSAAVRSQALNRAIGDLQALQDNLSDAPVVEQAVSRQVYTHWLDILGRVARTVGRLAVESPLFNPFVAGSPVKGDLFVGRADILATIRALCASNGQGGSRSSVVLYGHRRMGKTSILHQLVATKLSPSDHLALCSMQSIGLPTNTAELLHVFADAIHADLVRAGVALPAFDDAAFHSAQLPPTHRVPTLFAASARRHWRKSTLVVDDR